MRAKKSLGQHFLRSERALSTIVDTADIHADNLVLEIGPGEGVLTERLLKLAGKVVAVEKDDNLYEMLKNKFSNEIALGKLDLVHGDILEFDPETLKFYKDLTYKLVANIPYNITGAILEKFLSANYQPEVMVLLVQKEVAERIVARDNKESILSISVKAFGTPEFVEVVKAGSFTPPPKVDSAILKIEKVERNLDEKTFFKVVKTGFAAKRKKLSSNLGQIFDKSIVLRAFESLDLDQNARAEDLRVEEWVSLTENLK